MLTADSQARTFCDVGQCLHTQGTFMLPCLVCIMLQLISPQCMSILRLNGHCLWPFFSH